MLGKSVVALRTGRDRGENVARVLADMDNQIDWHRYRRVLIKPNFVSLDNQIAATHVDAVRALVAHVRKRFQGEVWLIEGGAGHARLQGFRNFGYEQLAREFSVTLQEIGEAGAVCQDAFDHNWQPIQVMADNRMVNSEFLISITPPKFHDTVIFTASLKNVIMGSLLIEHLNAYRKGRRSFRRFKHWSRQVWDTWWPRIGQVLPQRLRCADWFIDFDFFMLRTFSEGDNRMRMHQSFPVMNLNLYLLARQIHPHLAIIDGHEVMCGDGPLEGQSATMHFALAGIDYVAVDATAARIMGIEPTNVGYLWYCAESGLGRMKETEIELVGSTSIESHAQQLPRHTTYDQQLKWRTAVALEVFTRLQTQLQTALQHRTGTLPDGVCLHRADYHSVEAFHD
jgi:uncharacterized protein (DUF362 family)